MVKFLSTLLRQRSLFRSTVRRNLRSHVRCLDRLCIRNLFGSRSGPDDFAQALTAFARAIRAHRRLARLAPEVFDATEVDRLARRRKEDAEWMALWEPALNQAYGSSPQEKSPCAPSPAEPQLSWSPRTLRAVEREFASWRFWMSAGKLAMARHKQRRPHALPSLTRVARLLEIAFDFAHLACGAPISKAELESSGHEQALADLKRIYGDDSSLTSSAVENLTSPALGTAKETPPDSSPACSPAALPQPPSSRADTKRDFTPCALVIGPHGLLCLQPIEERL
jgi:hypothetical protein